MSLLYKVGGSVDPPIQNGCWSLTESNKNTSYVLSLGVRVHQRDVCLEFSKCNTTMLEQNL